MGYYAFYGIDLLTAVYINNLSAWCKIDHEAWSNPMNYAHNLYLNGELVVDLVIPDDVTEVKNDVFECCNSLKSVAIHDGVTSIGNYAFQLCDGLENVIIGSCVTNIGDNAFYHCENIKHIYVKNYVAPTVGNDCFDETNYLNTILYVPQGALTAYKTADNWKEFKNIVEYDVTGIDNIEATEITVKISLTRVVLDGCEGKPVAIYSTSGSLVENIGTYTGQEILLDKGLYIVRVGNTVAKVKL